MSISNFQRCKFLKCIDLHLLFRIQIRRTSYPCAAAKSLQRQMYSTSTTLVGDICHNSAVLGVQSIREQNRDAQMDKTCVREPRRKPLKNHMPIGAVTVTNEPPDQRWLMNFANQPRLLVVFWILLIGLPLQVESNPTMNNAKVVVIGAGPSGIAAATKLLELGFQKVIILEAENRVGGRIYTIPFADNVIDLGAQWCHGEKGNVVYELANEYNLLESTGEVYDNYDCIRSNQEVLPTKVSQRLKNIVNDSLTTRQVDLLSYNGTLGSYITSKFYEALRRPENSDIDMTIAREFFENYKKFENSLEASDSLDDVSGKEYLEYWECEGDILLNWKDKGYVQLIRLLMKSSENESDFGVLNQRMVLGKTVKQIVWNDPTMVQVMCEDDEVIEADHVITTVSLGVLKEKHSKLFEPKLPAEKVRAIEGLGFGTVNKIFIEFPTQFWPSNWTGFTLLWREQDLGEIRGTNRAWLEDVFGFYAVSYQPKILSGWIIGANGRHMETLPDDEVLSGCMYLFRKFLKWEIPTPVNFKTSAWFSNENFRGSYSFLSMATEKLNTSVSALGSPLKDSKQKPVVLFAGEATSDHYFSTVHGAVEAGWREAQRLANFYASKTPKSQL